MGKGDRAGSRRDTQIGVMKFDANTLVLVTFLLVPILEQNPLGGFLLLGLLLALQLRR